MTWRLGVLSILCSAAAAYADCVAPAPPAAAGATTAQYQAAVAAFVKTNCFLTAPGWGHDRSPRLTGATANGATYSFHDQVQVYYSPTMLAWVQQNRPGTGEPGTAAIPDGAAMFAQVYPIAAKPPAGLSGSLVMIRQAGGRPTDPASGWF